MFQKLLEDTKKTRFDDMASQVKGAIEEAFEIFELSYSPAKNSDLDLDYTLVTGSFKTSLCIEF